jgi:hypothetical protein
MTNRQDQNSKRPQQPLNEKGMKDKQARQTQGGLQQQQQQQQNEQRQSR